MLLVLLEIDLVRITHLLSECSTSCSSRRYPTLLNLAAIPIFIRLTTATVLRALALRRGEQTRAHLKQ
jgi:hypothetical protein